MIARSLLACVSFVTALLLGAPGGAEPDPQPPTGGSVRSYEFGDGQFEVKPPRFPKAVHIQAATVDHIRAIRNPKRRFVPRITRQEVE